MSTTTDFAPALRATERAIRYAGHARIARSHKEHERLLDLAAAAEESRIDTAALDRYLAARRAMEARVRAEMDAMRAAQGNLTARASRAGPGARIRGLGERRSVRRYDIGETMITLSTTDTRLPADARTRGLYLVIRPTADVPRGQSVPAAFGVVSTHETLTAAERARDAQYDGARAQGGYCRDAVAVVA